MGMSSKLTFIALGLAVGAAGVGVLYSDLAYLPQAILLLFAGLLLLLQVAWRKLLDKKIEDSDVMSVISAVLGFVVLVSGLLVLFNAQPWSWFGSLANFAAIITGVFIIIQGLMTK